MLVVSSMMRPILAYNQQYIILYVTASLKEGLLLSITNSQCENNACTMCSPFLVEIWVWHSHFRAHLTSPHISRELLHTLSMRWVSDIRPPLGFHCIPCISSCLHDDSMVLPQPLERERDSTIVLGGHIWPIVYCNCAYIHVCYYLCSPFSDEYHIL